MNAPRRDPSPFEAQVYAAARRIPRGKVTTYARLGEAIGCGSARAVGQALKRNPFAPEVPCHRVVRTDRSPGGFAGASEGAEIERKLRLLRGEGVRLDPDGRVAADCLHEFS